MKLIIELPAEFREHFKMDKFKDSLGRICTDLDEIQARRNCRFRDPLPFMSGNYEKELMDVLEKALPNAIDLEQITVLKLDPQKLTPEQIKNLNVSFAPGCVFVDIAPEEFSSVNKGINHEKKIVQ